MSPASALASRCPPGSTRHRNEETNRRTGGDHASENSTREAEEAASPDKRAQTRKRKRKARDGSRSHRGQSETSPFQPRSLCVASKCAAHWYTTHYRQAYGLFACNGILFNHESPRRGENFVTRKITRAAGQEKPDDFVVATGESHTVYEFLNVAFEMEI
ncbi:hypothetical protein NL676_030800 [Syzygium grande]|nr:hypothetical protein NL676_030800 [Syzygium grande]